MPKPRTKTPACPYKADPNCPDDSLETQMARHYTRIEEALATYYGKAHDWRRDLSPEEIIIDLLTDLRHWCLDQPAISSLSEIISAEKFDTLIAHSLSHYLNERAELNATLSSPPPCPMCGEPLSHQPARPAEPDTNTSSTPACWFCTSCPYNSLLPKPHLTLTPTPKGGA